MIFGTSSPSVDSLRANIENFLVDTSYENELKETKNNSLFIIETGSRDTVRWARKILYNAIEYHIANVIEISDK